MLLPDMTTEEAVAFLVDRHEMAGRVKQALQTPWGEFNMPDLTPHIQRLMTPAADDTVGQSARSGLIGAGVGGLAGAGSALFGERRKHWLRNALTGAMMGGAAGAALPAGWQHLQAAIAKTPSMQAHEDNTRSQREHMEDVAPAGDYGAHFRAGLGAVAPSEAGQQIVDRIGGAQYGEAGAGAAGLAGRAAAGSAVGYGLGRAADRAARYSRFNPAIRGLGAKEIDAALGSTNGMGEAIANGATPFRGAAPRPGVVNNHLFRPTKTQWGTLASKLPRGKILPRAGAAAGAVLPLLDAAGIKVDPVGWVQRMFSNGDNQ